MRPLSHAITESSTGILSGLSCCHGRSNGRNLSTSRYDLVAGRSQLARDRRLSEMRSRSTCAANCRAPHSRFLDEKLVPRTPDSEIRRCPTLVVRGQADVVLESREALLDLVEPRLVRRIADLGEHELEVALNAREVL